MKKVILCLTALLVSASLFASQKKKQFVVRLANANGFQDYTRFDFDQGFSTNFSNSEDIEKVLSQNNLPTIYSYTSDNTACLINAYSDLSGNVQINLGVKVDSDGYYTFSETNSVNFTSMYIIRLHDGADNSYHNLAMGNYTTFVAASEPASGRFTVSVSIPPAYTLIPADCQNQNGVIAIVSDPTLNWQSVTLYNGNNAPVQTLNNVSGSFSFNGLSEDNYTVAYQDDAQYSSTETKALPGNAVTASIQNTAIIADANQEVQFYSASHNATSFTWTFSDGSIITGIANPYYTFGQGGTYNVNLRAYNAAGCEAYSSAQVEVTAPLGINENTAGKAEAYANGSTIYLNLPAASTPWQIHVYSILGEEVYSAESANQQLHFDLNVPPSYYIVALSNGKIRKIQKVSLN